jgi:hypothetical protein
MRNPLDFMELSALFLGHKSRVSAFQAIVLPGKTRNAHSLLKHHSLKVIMNCRPWFSMGRSWCNNLFEKDILGFVSGHQAVGSPTKMPHHKAK